MNEILTLIEYIKLNYSTAQYDHCLTVGELLKILERSVNKQKKDAEFLDKTPDDLPW